MENRNYQELLVSLNSIEDITQNPNWKDWIKSDVFVYELFNKTNFSNLSLIPKEILYKPGIILSCLEKLVSTKTPIEGDLSNDSSFCMYCCSLEPKYALLFPKLFVLKKELAEWYCREFSTKLTLKYLPKKYSSDIQFVKTYLKSNIDNFQFADKKIRNDLVFYQSLSLETRVKLFSYTENSINSDWDIACSVVTKNPVLYRKVDSILQKDPNFYLQALENLKSPATPKFLLRSSPDFIQDNEHCVWETVKKEAESLSYASTRLLNSTSFAYQLIFNMDAEQISTSLEYWSDHVKNSHIVFEELLPQIINAKSLHLLGAELKDNYEFMLKAVSIDSDQALPSCSPSLLSNSHFIVDAYNILDEKNQKRGRYDDSSEQSKIFDHIILKPGKDLDLISSLYSEFRDIFISIIFPKINDQNTSFIQHLNSYSIKNGELYQALEKLVLKDLLKDELVNQKSSSKRTKI